MFSSLASLIFGSNTSATTNSEEANQKQDSTRQDQQNSLRRIDAANTIEVTSSTPSVTGTSNNPKKANKRGKNKRGGAKSYKPRKQGWGQGQAQGNPTPEPSITKLLTPSNSFDEDIDEDDWFIVEKEEEEEDSLPRTDSEEELSIVEVQPKLAPTPLNAGPSVQHRCHQPHINSHSLYTGPRPQQQRNYSHRARNSGARSNGGAPINVSALSPPRSIAAGISTGASPVADGGVTQSLYVAAPSANAGRSGTGSVGFENGAYVSMEESWFVTPPPCFTSIGPINMETSPFENLLIEHPSMSVYHSIRSAQEATESFVNLDLGVVESQQRRETQPAPARENTQAVQQRRTSSARIDRHCAAQLKQELFARNGQKSHDKKERQSLCRGALARANKVRDMQGTSRRQRRSDMQHCRIVSGANNNRKCYF